MSDFYGSPERNLLGMILNDPETVGTLKVFPRQEWFQDKKLGRICHAIDKLGADLVQISKAADISLTDLVQIQTDAPRTMNPNAFVDQIFNLYKKSEIVSLASQWCIDDHSPDTAYFQNIDKDISAIQQLSQDGQEVLETDKALADWLQDKEDRMTGKIKPIESGFPSIDDLFAGGLHRGDLHVIAGRPGSGKSAFIKSMVVNMVKDNANMKALIISIEMTPNEFLDRICSEWASVEGTRLREAVDLTDDELDRVLKFGKEAHDKRFYFNRRQACNIFDIRRLAKVAKTKMGGLDLILVDHIHIIKNHNHRLDQRALIEEITIELKRIAQDIDVPVVAAAQMNRESEKRQDKNPLMSDLKGAGSIEQDANAIIFIHRPGLYDDEIDTSIADVKLVKNRHGKSPVNLNFTFNSPFTSFTEVE